MSWLKSFYCWCRQQTIRIWEMKGGWRMRQRRRKCFIMHVRWVEWEQNVWEMCAPSVCMCIYMDLMLVEKDDDSFAIYGTVMRKMTPRLWLDSECVCVRNEKIVMPAAITTLLSEMWYLFIAMLIILLKINL